MGFMQILPRDFLTANDQYPVYNAGTIGQDYGTGKKYQYVRVAIGATTANSLIAGRPVYWDVQANGTVKTDTGGTEGNFAGVLVTTVTTTYYTWIQIPEKGTEVAILVTNAATAKSILVPDSGNGVLKATDTTSAATAGGAGTEKIAINKAAGSNPATPATTLCEFL